MWVRTNTGTPLTGCAPPQPYVMAYVRRPKMKAPDSSYTFSTGLKSTPARAKRLVAVFLVSREVPVEDPHAVVLLERKLLGVAGTRDEPSSDIVA